MAQLLNLRWLPSIAKHLGLSLILPWSVSHALANLKDRVLLKISRWKAKLLSQAGRTSLLATVDSSLPSYGMSSLVFPIGWCRNVEREFKNFWWGFFPVKSRNLSLKSWGSICRPKLVGGLRLRLGICSQIQIQFGFSCVRRSIFAGHCLQTTPPLGWLLDFGCRLFFIFHFSPWALVVF